MSTVSITQPTLIGSDHDDRHRKAKPTLGDLSGAAGYTPSPHAIQRMHERGISPSEVMSAIIKPDYTTPEWNDTYHCRVWNFDRGDVRVCANPDTGEILTVIDLNGDFRSEPRQPCVEVEDLAKRNGNGRGSVKGNMRPPKPTSAAKSAARKATATAYLSKMDAAASREEFEYVFGQHEVEDIRYIVVTPKLAAAMLERNTRNRPKRDRDVDDWSGEQSAGRWLTTHQGIGFDRNGVLVDGQHRLEAIIDSGVEVRMPVAVGLDPAVFDVIDTGRKRSTQDALALLGEGRTTLMASIMRLGYLYDNDMTELGIRYRVQTAALMDYVKGREELIRAAAEFAGKIRAAKTMVGSAAGTAHYLLHRDLPKRAHRMVDAFLEATLDGVGLTRDDACYVLRRVCGNTNNRRDAITHLALVLKAWSQYSQGRKVTTLMWRGRVEPMPSVFVPPPDLTREWGNGGDG